MEQDSGFGTALNSTGSMAALGAAFGLLFSGLLVTSTAGIIIIVLLGLLAGALIGARGAQAA